MTTGKTDKIIMVRTREVPRVGLLEAGRDYPLPAKICRQLCDQGFAVASGKKPEPVTEPAKPTKASASKSTDNSGVIEK